MLLAVLALVRQLPPAEQQALAGLIVGGSHTCRHVLPTDYEPTNQTK